MTKLGGRGMYRTLMELLPVLQRMMDLMIGFKWETKHQQASSLISIISLNSAILKWRVSCLILYSLLEQALDLVKRNLEDGPDIKTQEGNATQALTVTSKTLLR